MIESESSFEKRFTKLVWRLTDHQMVFKPRAGLVALRHPLEEGAEDAPKLFEESKAALESLGIETISSIKVIEDDAGGAEVGRFFRNSEVDFICLLVCTWSSDTAVTQMLEFAGLPIMVRCFPGISTGSLCGAQQICCVLKELDKTYAFAFGEPGDADANNDVVSFARASALKRRLRTSRIGLAGYRTPGMTEVTFDEFEMKRSIGPAIHHFGLHELEKAFSLVPKEEALDLWNRITPRVGSVEVPDKDGLDSTSAYLALKKIAEDNRLDAFAVECYPDMMGRVCLAASLLADDGIPLACEGDANSAAVMLMLQMLTGGGVHNTDLLAVYDEDNSAVFSHCGSGSFSLAENKDSVTLGHVRLAGSGLCCLFPGKPGPVTMVNLVGRRGTYRMGILEGEAIPTDMVFAGNPLKVRLPVPIKEYLALIADNGLGHHWMAAYGNVAADLERFCGLAGIQTIIF